MLVTVLPVHRWLKYEETVEVGDRWSKPHVSTTSMHGLLELKRALMDGTCFVGLGIRLSGNETMAGWFPSFQLSTVVIHIVCVGHFNARYHT